MDLDFLQERPIIPSQNFVQFFWCDFLLPSTILYRLGQHKNQINPDQDRFLFLLMYGLQPQELLGISENPLQLPSTFGHPTNRNGLHSRVRGKETFLLPLHPKKNRQGFSVDPGLNPMAQIQNIGLGREFFE